MQEEKERRKGRERASAGLKRTGRCCKCDPVRTSQVTLCESNCGCDAMRWGRADDVRCDCCEEERCE